MNIEELFKDILEKLKRDQRPLIKLSNDEHNFLNETWKSILEANNLNDPKLIPVLCILDNTISLNTIYTHNILKTFEMALKTNDEVLVMTLGITRKHITEAHHKESRRIPIEVLDAFKALLKAKSGEVREWTLRNIEALGSQSAYLKKEVLESRPGLLQLFNNHNQACSQIIELLEKRWGLKK